MLFKQSGEKLEFIREDEFRLEKDLQKLVEANLDTIFDFVFVGSEVAIEGTGARMDTVAYDPESNAFIIIEYKRGSNASLVDQGYSYLKILLERKADFVLRYNERRDATKRVGDFDWSQARILFISPKFTDFQKNAATFGDMPFDLYEVTKYGDLISVDAVGKSTVRIGAMQGVVETREAKVPAVVKAVNAEIKVYTEQEHLDYMGDDEMTRVYYELKDRMAEIDPSLEIVARKIYIACKFRGKNIRKTPNICSLFFKRGWFEICLGLKSGELNNQAGLAYDISNRGWSATEWAIKMTKDTNMDDAMDYIRQAYRKQK